MKVSAFQNITIRGRVSYAICCLENAIDHYQLNDLDWSLLFEFLWRYPTSNELKDLALWHENEAECVPFCIMDSLPYEKSDFEFITKEQYLVFEKLYQNSNKLIWDLIDSIALIGTQYLYGGVRDGAPETLKEIDTIISALNQENIPLPEISNFETFNYPLNPQTDGVVWGEKMEPEALKKVSRFLNTNTK